MSPLTRAQTVHTSIVPLRAVNYIVCRKGVAHKIRRAGIVNDEVTRRRQRQINWTTDSRIINMTLRQVTLKSILVNRDSSPDQAIKWSRQFRKCRAQLAIHSY